MNTKPNFATLARTGYASRGIVYLLLGALAVASAYGGGDEPSSKGALATLLGQPFGRILLGLVALGLIAFVLWRLAQAFLNADRVDNDAKGWAGRAGSLAAGIADGALALFAAQLALGMGGNSEDGQGEESMTAWLMSQPFGRWLVAAVGLVIIVAGLIQAYRGIAGKYREQIKLPADKESWLHPLCAFGLAARGVLLAIIGGFLVYAGITVDPEQAGSLTDALEWVRALPFGSLFYGLAALGLLAFGIYSLVEARYRQISPPQLPDAVGKIKAAVA